MSEKIFANQSTRFIKIGFYLFWFIIAILQARFTQLIPDEAYYWVWSKHLSWGYFDHPPAIALMIKLGYSIFENELGVRIFAILCSVGFIYLIEKMVNPNNLLLFYSSLISIAILQFFAFISVPDSPLLFFAALFFYLYGKFLEKETPVIILLLALNVALLLLSKYHGTLVIFFTLLSNFAILKKRSVWLIFLLSIIFLIPHLLWQYQNGAPSVVFQLFERAHERYSFSTTFEYLISILGVFGPLTGTVLLIASFIYKPKTLFEKALKYNLIGTLAFFTVMTVKGRVEITWIICTIIPTICLGYKSLESNKKFIKTVRYSLPISLVLIALVKIFMVYDFVPKKWKFENDFHGCNEWANSIKKVAEGRTVVFTNSYQRAAEYEFYAGENSLSFSSMTSRKSEYNILSKENDAQGKEVLLCTNYDFESMQKLETINEIVRYRVLNNFRTPTNIQINFTDKHPVINAGNSLPLNFNLNVKEGCNVDVENNKDFPAVIWYEVYEYRRMIIEKETNFRIVNSMLNDGKTYSVNVELPKEKGKYKVFLSIKAGMLPNAINSRSLSVQVE